MNSASIIISSISTAIAICSLVWAIINDKKNRKTQQTLAFLQGRIDKGNYISKVVFDKIFIQFQELSACMFDNYNNAASKMFPFIDQVICFIATKQEKLNKMLEYYNQSKSDLNNLIKLIQINRFLLTNKMIELLLKFELIMKELIIWYDEKIRDVNNESIAKIITSEKEQELTEKANTTLELYNEITDCFKNYIEQLKIAE